MKKIVIIASLLIILTGIVGIFFAYNYYNSSRLVSVTNDNKHIKTPTILKASPSVKIQDVTDDPNKPRGVEEEINLEFRMTGAIVLPQFKSSFILNTATSQEGVFQEGSFLDSKEYGRWIVASIKQNETIIHQYHQDGSVAKEHILTIAPTTQTTKSTLAHIYMPGEKKFGLIKNGIDITSPESIDKALAKTPANEVLGIVRSIPDSIIESVLKVLPQDYLKQKIQNSPLGLAITEDTFQGRNPSDIINMLRKSADDYTPRGENMLSFALEVNSDNSPISPTYIFKPDTKKIYACFENKNPLSKLDRVVIKWANVSTQKIIYWSSFMINPDSPFNFIFVNPEGRWDTGHYLISIYRQLHDPTPSAYGQFEVK